MKKRQNHAKSKAYFRLVKLDYITEELTSDRNYLTQLSILERYLNWYRDRFESRSRRRLSNRKWCERHGLICAYNIDL